MYDFLQLTFSHYKTAINHGVYDNNRRKILYHFDKNYIVKII